MKNDISGFYKDHKALVWLILVLAPLAVIIIGSLLAREIFWDSFLWRYFWGPVVADAEGDPVDGVSAGYNVVNTVTYGIILVVSFFGTFELIEHFEVNIDRSFVYSLLPWIILGGSLRSLEDAGLFADPLDKLMITPMIYLVIGFSAILLMLLGAYISTIELSPKRSKFLRLAVLTPLPIIYVVLRNYIDPFFLIYTIIIIVSILISYHVGSRYLEFDEKYFFLTYGISLLALALTFNLYFIFFREGANPFEVPIIFLSSVTATLLFLGLSAAVDRVPIRQFRSRSLEIVKRPLNVLIIWSHLFDASSTYRGVTAYGYFEKHVLPAYLMDFTGAYAIFIANIILVVVVIYVLDVTLEKEFSRDQRLRTFLKFVLIILGASPAVRNTLRIAMGV